VVHVESLIESPNALLTVDEVARLWRISPKTAYRLIAKDPTFPRVKVGGSVRVPRARFLSWMERRTQGEATPRPGRRSA
jgi:excisionase family DNA binding protein